MSLKKTDDSSEDYKKKRKIIIVMAGGLCHSELSSLQKTDIDKESEIILVASNMLNQETFIQQIKDTKNDFISLEISDT
jgi:hypothetical protein